MILYKYTDIKTANLILKNATLKFSRAASLNDPFELSGMHYQKNATWSNDDRYEAVALFYGILSLTRNPLNPLMWAHYAKGKKAPNNDILCLDYDNNSHAGLVFGIDVEQAQLNSLDLNYLPAKYGSVIYTSTKPINPFENSDNWNALQIDFKFNPDYLEALQRIFLYKSSHWSYEEEVRVVRNMLYSASGEIVSFDRSSFKEVYIGIRNAKDKKYLNSMRRKIKKYLPDCIIYVCDYDPAEWTLKKITIEQALERSN